MLSKRRVIRAESPQTAFTEATSAFTLKSVIPTEGAFIHQPSREVDTEMTGEDDHEVETKGAGPGEGAAQPGPSRGQQEEEEEEEEEAMRYPTPPPPPPLCPPAVGLGLQYGPVHKELSLTFIFSSILGVLNKFNSTELMWFKKQVAQRHKEKVNAEQLLDSDWLNTVDYLIEHFRLGGATRIAATCMHLIGRDKHCEELEGICKRILVRHELQESIQRNFNIVFEGVPRPGDQAGLNRIFTAPLVTEGGHRGVNTNHEYLHNLQPAWGEPRRVCHFNDVLRPYPEGSSDRPRLTVLTATPMGGLSYVMSKFALDWSKERANQDIHFLFYFKCKELRWYTDDQFSVMKMLKHFHHAIEVVNTMLTQPESHVTLIFDGWQPERPKVDWEAPVITDIWQKAPMKQILANLIRGDLLPDARLLITCRRHDLDTIPHYLIGRVFEVRGFSAEQREDFFAKHYDRDMTVGARVLEKIKTQPNIFYMSQLPVFAWVTAFLFERRCLRSPQWADRHGHETLLYVHLVMLLINRWFERYRGDEQDNLKWQQHDKDMMMRLGRLAWKSLETRQTRFSHAQLKEHDLDSTDLIRIGIMAAELPEWKPSEAGCKAMTAECNRPISFSFTHHSIMEFMAAWYVYLGFRIEGRNVFEQSIRSTVVSALVKDRSILDLYKPAIERALVSRDGHLDLFLRFLFGLALDSTEDNIRGTMLPHRHPSPKGLQDSKTYLRRRIEELEPASAVIASGTNAGASNNSSANLVSVHPDRVFNLTRCVEEVTELVDDIFM
ncbi:NLR family CARD domain-containing protein 3 isoform X2 [Engraulis encrasicolus]|uniref:NLR family CARD domain-containing protein 3 isoform X2 n=1 Tax=Engraulis encrasicolus TaxID=184585 RepID=UPI002FD65C2A